METCVIFVLAVLFHSTLCASPNETKRYRSDYVYNPETDAFYKLRLRTVKGWRLDVDIACTVEGAKPMTATEQDMKQARELFKKFPGIGNYAWIARIDQNRTKRSYLHSDEDSDSDSDAILLTAKCDMATRDGKIENTLCYERSELPVLCKVEAKDAPYDSQCDVFANNYKYNPTVGSCYKIPPKVLSWNDADAECRAEGAHLVVLNSEAERTIVHNLIMNTRVIDEDPYVVYNLYYVKDTNFLAGFKANTLEGNVVFRTIFNQTVEEAGFAKWSSNEPNNYKNNEYCGSIMKDGGNLNDVNCSDRYPFVCEKEVHKRN